MATTNKGDVTHEMLASDVALVYRWQATPEGCGLRLDRRTDGRWQGENGVTYETIAEAESRYAAD